MEKKENKVYPKKKVQTGVKKNPLLKTNVDSSRVVKILGVLIILEIFLFAMPNEFLYGKARFIALAIAVVSIFLVIPYLLTLVLNDLFNFKNAMAIGICSILLNGPLFGFYHLQRENKNLALNGKVVVGEVIEKKFMDTKRGDYWALKAKYKVENEEYQTGFEWVDGIGQYQIGDEIKILYLDNYPRVFRVSGEVFEKWNEAYKRAEDLKK